MRTAATNDAGVSAISNRCETVFRIDPSRSRASYRVAEKIVGHTAHHATGSTNGIAGDLAINRADPPASRVGEIVVHFPRAGFSVLPG